MKVMRYTLVAVLLLMGVRTKQVYGDMYKEPLIKIIVDDVVRNELESKRIGSDYYVSVRTLVDIIGGKVVWNPYSGETKIVYRGRPHTIDTLIFEDKAYLNVTDLRTIYGGSVDIYPDINVVAIGTTGHYFDRANLINTLPTYEGYNQEDLYWLARIINAEATGEPYEGMMAVGSVIMNRVDHTTYPNDVKGVVFDMRNGIQFSPVANGAIYKNPSDISIVAAVELLEGRRNEEDILFFYNPKIAQTSWIGRNREHAYTVLNHAFYY